MNKRILLILPISIAILISIYYLLQIRKANTPLGCLTSSYPNCYETFMINKASITPKLDCLEIGTDNCKDPDITVYNYCPNKVIVEGRAMELPSELCEFGKVQYRKTHKDGKYVISKTTYGENYNKNDTKEEIILGDTVDVDIKIGTNIYKYTLFENTKDWTHSSGEKVIGNCLNIERRGWRLKFVSNCNESVYIDGWEVGAHKSTTDTMDACSLLHSWIELDKVYSAPANTIRKDKKLVYDGNEYTISYSVTESMCKSTKEKNY